MPEPGDDDRAAHRTDTARDTMMRAYSLEVTCKDLEQIRHAAGDLQPSTRINVTALARETDEDRLSVIAGIIELGLRPVPHIAARRIESTNQLSALLARLAKLGASRELFVIGGDAKDPAGPFASALELIESGVLPDFGVQSVGVAAYPDGHPLIGRGVLEEAFVKKTTALVEQGLKPYAISQFCFDPQAVSRWVRAVAAQAEDVELRVGLPGPATVRRLLRYASAFGVRSSTAIIRKYGLSLTNLMSTAKPAAFVDALARLLSDPAPASARLHFYTFGAVSDTVRWINEFTTRGRRDGATTD